MGTLCLLGYQLIITHASTGLCQIFLLQNLVVGIIQAEQFTDTASVLHSPKPSPETEIRKYSILTNTPLHVRLTENLSKSQTLPDTSKEHFF